MHASARTDAGERLRHERFVLSRLIVGAGALFFFGQGLVDLIFPSQ